MRSSISHEGGRLGLAQSRKTGKDWIYFSRVGERNIGFSSVAQ